MTRTKSLLSLTCALALCAAPALAGPLATAPGVYFDGFTTWHGSSPYQGYFDPPFNTSPSGLSGDIDWAVWAPGTFPGFAGYTPTLGEYVYTYQLYETGSAPLTQNIVFTINEADNIGAFTGDAGFGLIDGVAPDFLDLVPFSSAEWTFFSGVLSGEHTIGLAFSSPNPPEMSGSVQIDDGTFSFAMVPAPGGPVIPEPGTFVLASCGLGMMSLFYLRRRSRRVARG
ncbi:MAG: PEP-CTERM sorting domain-containing protein [Pirellulales bacterium]